MNVAFSSAAVRRPLYAAAALAFAVACGKDGPTGNVTPNPAPNSSCVPVKQGLAVGESVILPSGKPCVELTTPGARYSLGVVNTGRAVSSLTSYELVGWAPDSPTQSVGALGSVAVDPRLAGEPAIDPAMVRQAEAHDRILAASRDAARRFRVAGPTASRTGGASFSESVSAGPTTTLRTVGDTATLRIPNIDAANACSATPFEVKTRLVYAGQRALIVEDVAAPLAGKMDDSLRAIGEEFDSVMWPILTEYFGDPLKLDATLDANQRIVMLFSPVLNREFDEIAGFVIGCDFFPRSQAASSNEGEIFYAMVPTDSTSGPSSNKSITGWRRTMRSTIIHEAKHITSYVERITAGAEPEESWLEEGTARQAEELYARRLNGATWKGNTGYAALSCEVRLSSTCAGRPYVMFKHFDALYDFLAANGTRSPLGKANTDDFTFYASAWALTRWAADRASNEASFFRALTRGPAVGIDNLAAVSGRTWPDIVGDWTMAMALDDVVSSNRPQSVLSWNLRDVFAGMHADFGNAYARYPLQPNQRSFGSFVQTGQVRAGHGAVTELSGTWAGTQRLEVQLPGGGAPPSTLRLVVTRVQ